MDGFSKLIGSANPENGDYAAGLNTVIVTTGSQIVERQKQAAIELNEKFNKQPSVIEQITAIIDKGGPFSVKRVAVEPLFRVKDDAFNFYSEAANHETAENECERLNSEYVAKAILKCLQWAAVDFKSVYDKKLWQDTIKGIMK